MKTSKAMALKYMNEESLTIKKVNRRGDQVQLADTFIFKDIDGIRKVLDLKLPGLLELFTESCDALVLRASRNSEYDYIPIKEYIRDRQSILAKNKTNGLYLTCHDASMRALLYKTTQSLPEIPHYNIFLLYSCEHGRF